MPRRARPHKSSRIGILRHNRHPTMRSTAEVHDQYAALWLGAECAEFLRLPNLQAKAMRDRLRVQARALGYVPLVTMLSAA